MLAKLLMIRSSKDTQERKEKIPESLQSAQNEGIRIQKYLL
jgi:hypothetical protein